MVQVTMMRSKATKKVLYVEAGKDFVDLLLSFLVLPVGSVVARLSGKTGVPDIDASLGAITSILKSVGKLGARHLNVAEGSLVRPTVSVHSRECVGEPAEKLLGICLDSQPGSVETFYRCDNCWLMSRDEGKCPKCRHYGAMNKFTVPGIVPTSGPGIAKDFPYIVTDDLTITPSSADTCFNLLRSMNVLSVEDLESSSIQVGPQQALKLLAASFTSRTALTDAFVVPDAVEPGSGHDSVAI